MKRRQPRDGHSTAVASAEAYNLGNRHLEQGCLTAAIAQYTTALGLAAAGRLAEARVTAALAYYNRAVAYAKQGDETAALADLRSAGAAGLDEDYFYDALVRHQRLSGGFASVLALCDSWDLPTRQRHRLERELCRHLHETYFLLDEHPEAGMTFSGESLALRCDLADLLSSRPDPDVVVDRILTRLADHVADAEAEWRARYLIAAVYASGVLQPLETIDGHVGLFFGDPDREPAFAVSYDEQLMAPLDDVLCRHDQRWAGFDRRVRFIQFALAQLEAAAEALVADRGFRLVSDVSWVQWDVVEGLFRASVELSLHLRDAGAYQRTVERARHFNALVGASSWFGSAESADWDPAAIRQRLDALYGRGTVQRPAPVPGTLVLDYFVFEKFSDTVAWRTLGPTGSRLGATPISPDQVEDCLKIARQWEQADTFVAHAGSGTSTRDAAGLLRLVARARLANWDVPANGYPTSVDEAILGGIDDLLGSAERLVVVPWGYLHNVPIHLLPRIRSAVDSGRLREIVYSPNGTSAGTSRAMTPSARSSARLLFVGVGADSPLLAAEADRMRVLLPNGLFLVERGATPERVLEELPKSDIAHFACHGAFDRGANAAFLQLHGGRLYPADLLSSGGPMPALVVMNACVTGVTGAAGQNGDAAMGLPHALLAAGAADVVGTLWEIDDEAAFEFAVRFFRRWIGAVTATTGELVVDVQNEIRRLPEFNDMFLWGAHAVWTNGRRRQ